MKRILTHLFLENTILIKLIYTVLFFTQACCLVRIKRKEKPTSSRLQPVGYKCMSWIWGRFLGSPPRKKKETPEKRKQKRARNYCVGLFFLFRSFLPSYPSFFLSLYLRMAGLPLSERLACVASGLCIAFAGVIACKWWLLSSLINLGEDDESGDRVDRSPEAGRNADNLEKEISELISCPICFDLPARPMELGCGHTVCLFCTDELYAHEAMRGSSGPIKVKCPICRSVVSKPIAELSTNVVVQQLVELSVKQSGGSTDHLERRKECEVLLELRKKKGYPRAVVNPSTIRSRAPLRAHGGGDGLLSFL